MASARLPGLQRQLLTLGDSTNAMWEVINGLVQGGEQGGASREDDFGSARRGAAYDYSDEVQFPQPVYAACSDVGRRRPWAVFESCAKMVPDFLPRGQTSTAPSWQSEEHAAFAGVSHKLWAKPRFFPRNGWFFIKVVSCCNRRERLGGQV